MGQIIKPYTFSAGATIIAAEHNSDFDTIYTEFNGNIENANIKSTAAIVDTKLAQIATAAKVAGTALTGLASIPSGAGFIPNDNILYAGTWTATFLSSSTGNVNIATFNSAGYYTKIGKQINITGRFQVASVSTAAGGNLLLLGLPYVSGTSSWHNAGVTVYATAISSAASSVIGSIQSGSSQIVLQRLTAGVATGMVADISCGSIFHIGGTYFTN